MTRRFIATLCFAKNEFTNRQYDYAALRGERSVYTPQVVVNGGDHAVGSNPRAISTLTEDAYLPVKIGISESDTSIMVSISDHPIVNEASVWLFPYKKRAEVAVSRGENRDRVLEFTNIVREIRPLGEWDGEKKVMRFKKSEIFSGDIDGFAIVAQTMQGRFSSTVVGAASWSE